MEGELEVRLKVKDLRVLRAADKVKDGGESFCE